MVRDNILPFLHSFFYTMRENTKTFTSFCDCFININSCLIDKRLVLSMLTNNSHKDSFTTGLTRNKAINWKFPTVFKWVVNK